MFDKVKNKTIGVGVQIDPSVQIEELEELTLGDHTYLGPNVRIFGGGKLSIGEYSKIHRGTTIYVKGTVKLGNITWIAQNCYLDGTGEILAGNFLGIGHNSVLYTHMRHGDELEGYEMGKTNRLIIGNDVCFSGTCFVCPIKAEDKSLALLATMINRNMKANRLYAGNPMQDVTESYRKVPWREVSVEEKFEKLNELINEYGDQVKNDLDRERLKVVLEYPDANNLDKGVTYYNVANRTYLKRNSKEEVEFNKWIFSSKAKFTPHVLE